MNAVKKDSHVFQNAVPLLTHSALQSDLQHLADLQVISKSNYQAKSIISAICFGFVPDLGVCNSLSASECYDFYVTTYC